MLPEFFDALNNYLFNATLAASGRNSNRSFIPIPAARRCSVRIDGLALPLSSLLKNQSDLSDGSWGVSVCTILKILFFKFIIEYTIKRTKNAGFPGIIFANNSSKLMKSDGTIFDGSEILYDGLF